jgi:hypothetical protein
MEVTVTKTVNRCYDCPHFNSHPHEASCGILEKQKSYSGLISHRVAKAGIIPKCPLQNKTKRVNANITGMHAYHDKGDFSSRFNMDFTFTDKETKVTYIGTVNDSVFRVEQEIAKVKDTINARV